MKKFFDYEGGIWKLFGRIGDLMILNVLFIVCSIPIVTIGASKTALYGVTKKMAKDEEGYIFQEFFKQFKENFKQSTKIWLIYLGACILPIIDLYACSFMEQGSFVTFCRSVMILTLTVFTIMMLYSFALQSTFENTLKNTIKNSFIMGIGHFPFSFTILFMEFTPVIAVLFLTKFIGLEMLFITMIWYALVALINSYMFNHIFGKYIGKDEKPEEVNKA